MGKHKAFNKNPRKKNRRIPTDIKLTPQQTNEIMGVLLGVSIVNGLIYGTGKYKGVTISIIGTDSDDPSPTPPDDDPDPISE